MKKIGSSMLRNMYLTNKYGDLMKELKTDVSDMGTSVGVAMNNYIKLIALFMVFLKSGEYAI